MVEAVSRVEQSRHNNLVARYLTSIAHRSPRTVATYRDVLRILQDNLNGPLENTPIDDLMLLFTRLSEHYEESTLNVMRAALKGFLRFCGRDAEVKMIKYSNLKWMPRSDLAQEQLDRVLDHTRLNERGISEAELTALGGWRSAQQVHEYIQTVPKKLEKKVAKVHPFWR